MQQSSFQVKYSNWEHYPFNKIKLFSPFFIPLIFHYKAVNGWPETHTLTDTVTQPFLLFVLFYIVCFSVPKTFR